ncbi:MAG: SpoIIIAH-like family protein [Firmicutes bacterium]|nr:SpoIIIAH-like family protein [Bacillota bacterium]
MMFGWTESKRERRKQRRGGPARWGLLLFALACVAVAYWDSNYQGAGSGPAAAAETTAETETVAAAAEPGPETGTDTETAETDAESGSAAALFAAYRLERESSREEELALLQEILDDPMSSPAAREEAEQRRLAVAAAVEGEAAAESLLRARGFGETVVLVSGEQATVICDLELTGAAAAQIAAVAAECCGVSFENVIIVNR